MIYLVFAAKKNERKGFRNARIVLKMPSPITIMIFVPMRGALR
jgi:hypothetical protein